MKNLLFSAPTFGFVVGTRVALAFGLGLLVADKLEPRRRRAIALSLVGLGAVTTIPAAAALARAGRASRQPAPGQVGREPRLVGATRFPRRGDEWDRTSDDIASGW
jgi:hypothetical protein